MSEYTPGGTMTAEVMRAKLDATRALAQSLLLNERHQNHDDGRSADTLHDEDGRAILAILDSEGKPDPEPWVYFDGTRRAEPLNQDPGNPYASLWKYAPRSQEELMAADETVESLRAERDALQAKLDAVRKLAESTDRGIGYRVSGDHSTWGEYHEGRSALGGEIQSILDGEETS